ncbi:unnamed protein product [Aspergillus oryzae]|nr:unnamed protein product [Aspergillus oryzae]GMF96014.1 unnamed protein product [Aspergillus oryzae]
MATFVLSASQPDEKALSKYHMVINRLQTVIPYTGELTTSVSICRSHLSENEFSSPGRLDAISTSYAYAMTQVMGKVDANLCRTTFAIGYQIQCWLGVISPEQAGCSWLTKSAFPMTGPWSIGWDSPPFLVIMIGSKSWASWSHPTWEDVAVLQATIVGQARVLWRPAYVSQPGHEIKLGDKGSTQLLAFSAHVLLRGCICASEDMPGALAISVSSTVKSD